MILNILFFMLFIALIIILFCSIGLYILHIREKEEKEKINNSKKTK